MLPGPAVRIDIPLDPLGAVGLTLQKPASRTEVSAGDFVQYQLTLRNATALPATGLQLVDVLPLGFRFARTRCASTLRAARPAAAVRVGRRAHLDDLRGRPRSRRAVVITYVVEVTAGAPRGDAINTAIGSAAEGIGTNRADATVRVRDAFFGSCAVLVGRVVEGECSTPDEELAGRRRRADPARRRHLHEHRSERPVPLRERLRRHPRGAARSRQPAARHRDDPVHPEHALRGPLVLAVRRRAGRNALAHRLLRAAQAAAAIRRARRRGAPAPAPAPPAATTRTPPARRAIPDDATAAGGKTDWLAEAVKAPGNGWLFPPENHNPRAPAQRVVIRHEPAQQVKLWIEGALVDPLSFDGTKTSADGRVAVSVWRGIPLDEGDNEFVAEIVDAAGGAVAAARRASCTSPTRPRAPSSCPSSPCSSPTVSRSP